MVDGKKYSQEMSIQSMAAAIPLHLDYLLFDACLMGTVETANILATYADYMIGSEETEPGSGWDYTEIGSFLAKNPNANGAELGKVVCDSFLAACAAQDDDELTTLAVIDLGKLDEFLVSFNDFSKEILRNQHDQFYHHQLHIRFHNLHFHNIHSYRRIEHHFYME